MIGPSQKKPKKKPKKTWGCPHNYLKRWQYTPQLHLGGWRFWIWLVDLVFSLLEKATPPTTHHPPKRGVLCPPLCIFRAVCSPRHIWGPKHGLTMRPRTEQCTIHWKPVITRVGVGKFLELGTTYPPVINMVPCSIINYSKIWFWYITMVLKKV